MKKMSEGNCADALNDFLSLMITASKDEAQSVITKESFTDTLLILMFGGYVVYLSCDLKLHHLIVTRRRLDTTSIALSVATALLHQSPGVKAALHSELDAVMPEDLTAFSHDTVRSFKRSC